MKFLIVGLGNPGREYAMNRHNIGFRIVDALAGEVPFSPDRHGETCVVKFKGKQLILLKPGTYMNLSGKAVRYHLDKHKIEISSLMVITDDIALPFGKLRLKPKGSDGGHNGLKSIQELLGTQEYARLRCGVGNEFHKGAQADYVLGDFSPEEEITLKLLIPRAVQCIQGFATIGIEKAMTQFNG
jgi:peptidyl-tRNA hydrolase, PTH1 family